MTGVRWVVRKKQRMRFADTPKMEFEGARVGPDNPVKMRAIADKLFHMFNIGTYTYTATRP